MSVQFTAASTQKLTLSAAAPWNSPYTFMGWIYPTSLSGDPSPFTINDGSNSYMQLGISQSNNWFFLIDTNGGASSAAVSSVVPAINTWYYIVAQRTSTTNANLYIGTTPNNVALQDFNNTDITSRPAATTVTVGSYPLFGGSNYWNGNILGAKFYSTALTLAEIIAEANSISPVKITNLWGWWPLIQSGQYYDYSGNGRALTATGSPATGDNIYVPYSANRTQIIAIPNITVRLNDQSDSTLYTSPAASLSSTLYMDMPSSRPDPGPITVYLRLRRQP